MSYIFRRLQLCIVALLVVVPLAAENEHIATGTSAFEAKIGKGKPLVVKFGAPWCGACRASKPKFEIIAQELSKDAHFVEINVDKDSTTAKKYNVASLPTFIVFDKQGKEISRTVGNVTDLQVQIKKGIEHSKK